ncbi:unnamed protein product, partial [marine sediment metagenome]
DRHNNGGFSSGEKATGNPYHLAPIETCCTIAWMAMSVEMLRLTGDPVVADELELSTLNSVVGMHSASGRWATYNTPMNGIRRASAHSTVFQARQGTPELNCCSVNSPRGFGMISDWALMRDADGLILNWYGPSEITTEMKIAPKKALSVTLKQETSYPLGERVRIRVTPSETAQFCLKLRVPYWSANTKVLVNGRTVPGVRPAAYLRLDRKWRKGDRIDMEIDMSLHFWTGARNCGGLTSVYRGPLLLAFDHRYNLELSRKGDRILHIDEWKPPGDMML